MNKLVEDYQSRRHSDRMCVACESAIDAVFKSANGPHVEFQPCLVTQDGDSLTVEVNLRLCVAATVPAIVAELKRILAAIEGQ